MQTINISIPALTRVWNILLAYLQPLTLTYYVTNYSTLVHLNQTLCAKAA